MTSDDIHRIKNEFVMARGDEEIAKWAMTHFDAIFDHITQRESDFEVMVDHVLYAKHHLDQFEVVHVAKEKKH